MALIASGFHGSSPGMTYECYAEQTSGSGNNRTIKITLKLKAGQYATSFYGYPVQWRANVNGSWSGWMTVKGGESWRGSDGFRTFTYTATTNVGTSSSKSITVGFETDSVGYTHWDLTKTGSLTVSQTNVAPTISGTVTTSPSGTFSETTSSVTVTSPQASDANGNLSGYRCQVSINGGSWTQIYSGASRTFTHNISSYGEGTSFAYKFDAYDSAGAWSSGSATSATIYKNKFNMDSITSAGSITYSSSNISIAFGGGSNTQSGVSITRKLSCNNGITVYNPTVTTSPITLTIYKSGTAPSTPYIKFDDLKKVFATSTNKGKGTLTFTLTGTNSNGTVKTSTKVVSVNLTTTPPKVTNAIISTVQSESTNYLTVASTTNKYFIPDGSKHTRVKWDVKTGSIGESLTYQLFVAYGSGSYTKVADIASGVAYYNHVIPKQTVSQAFKYKIRAISSYDSNLYSEVETTAQTLHYYNEVGLTQGTITRTSTGADVIVTIKSNSSIPNINTKGTWKNCTAGTTTALTSGNLTVAQTAQTIKITGLSDGGTYDLIITYNDNTGFVTANKTATIRIGANLPVMFVNKYGVGVNGVSADSSNSFKVKGNSNIAGTLNATNLQVGGANVYHTGRKPTPADIGASPSSHGHTHVNVPDVRNTNPTPNDCSDKTISSFFNNQYGDAWRSGITVKGWTDGYCTWQLSNPSSTTLSEDLKFRAGMGTSWNPWRKIYHEGNKPTLSELSAYGFQGLLGDNENLNNYTKTGFYTQGSNAQASNGTNYPRPYAGVLEVHASTDGAMIWQKYHIYGWDNSVWVRTYYAGTWNPWRASAYAYDLSHESYVKPTFQNGWKSYGGSYDVRFTKDSMRVVHLEGLATGGTMGKTIFNLPVGYRPKQGFQQAVANNFNGYGQIVIYPGGDVSAYCGSSGWMSLDGISFLADV